MSRQKRLARHEAGHTLAAVNFGIPIIKVMIPNERPHLHRGFYKPTHDLGVECLATLCLAGPSRGRIDLRCDHRRCAQIDQQMARGYLRERYSEAQLALQLERMQLVAQRLVVPQQAKIETVAAALLRHGTLTGDQILELLNGSTASGVR